MVEDVDFIKVNEFIDELVNEGLTWVEIGEICNEKYGKSYTESKWRKPYQVWRKTVDSVIYAESDKIVEQELKRIARAKSRLDINRQILNQQRSILNEDIRNAALVEMFNDDLRAVLAQKVSIDTKVPKKVEHGSTPHQTSLNYVFVKSDGHYNGNQDLDLEFSEFFTIIADKKKEYGFNEIVLAELGDTIEGASLRPSQLLAVKNGMVEQAMTIANYYIEFLNTVSRELNLKIKFLIVESSNHTQLRQLGTGRSELPMEDLMVLIAEMVKEGTRGNDLIEIESAPIIRTKINGISYIMEHGHDAPKKKSYLQKRESFYNELYDFAYMGHFHNYASYDISEVEGEFRNKNVTYVPHSCTVESTFANVKHLSSVPAIHFSIDSAEGKLKQENIVMKESYKKMKELENIKKSPKGKIVKLKK